MWHCLNVLQVLIFALFYSPLIWISECWFESPMQDQPDGKIRVLDCHLMYQLHLHEWQWQLLQMGTRRKIDCDGFFEEKEPTLKFYFLSNLKSVPHQLQCVVGCIGYPRQIPRTQPLHLSFRSQQCKSKTFLGLPFLHSSRLGCRGHSCRAINL